MSKPVALDFLPAPLNVAGGTEYRHETYKLEAGDAASRYKSGSQAFPGYQFTDARDVERDIVAVYTELGTRFTPEWQVSLATRAEHYSDAGDTAIGKLATRYDFNPRFALRATASTGFRAPTLAEQNFSATNVTPTVSNIQLAVNSPAATLLGAPQLKPEESENVSLGLVFEPLDNVFASIDIFQIDIDERIINTGNLNGPAVRDAIASNGIFFQGSSANLAFFTNGVDTRTEGVDLVLDWSTDLDAYGQIRWNLTGTRIKTEVTHIKNASPQLGGGLLITPVIISGLEESTPEHKFSISANYYFGDFNFLLRLTRYGESSQLSSDAGTGLAPFTLNTISPETLTDIALGYDFNDAFSLTLGANNLFDKNPEETATITRGATNASVYPTFAPYSVDGTYYYLRSSFRF